MTWNPVTLPVSAPEMERQLRETFPGSLGHRYLHNCLVAQLRRAEQALRTCASLEDMKENQGRIRAIEETLAGLNLYTPTHLRNEYGS